ncbi:factor-independent urate hydroxylase [Actinocorallia sp. A-T 12471]|uniref:factor-independent urate hydroxylase n=1 Tax=Actinocorallia sp. A-T 12471 TaxID=3089813 RepID=UPI0029CFDACD|nr:urate oxidase [Actinocorallia sp. A-T 12471]MDX6743545.1 urate oxidase [Actinocorallia sp. A-T 12471]
MKFSLGPNGYGKAECRLVRVERDGGRHALTDLNVSTKLSGDLEATHLTGDNSGVLPTDTQKNTVYAFARQFGIGEIELFATSLASHFVASQEQITKARVAIDAYSWDRVGDHSFAKAGGEIRAAVATVTSDGAWITGGLRGLTLMNTTDSEFHGFPRDEYTTLAETSERILATDVAATWRFGTLDVDWGPAYTLIRESLISAFVETYSLSLQQTLYAMGARVLEKVPEVAEVRLSLPNKHHFLVDLSPFGLDNPDEVYFAADRPYGLIEGGVVRDGAPDEGLAWSS